MQNVKLVIAKKAFQLKANSPLSNRSKVGSLCGEVQVNKFEQIRWLGSCMVKAGAGLWPRCSHIDTYMDIFNIVHFRPQPPNPLRWTDQMNPSDSPLARHLLTSWRKWAADWSIFYWLTGDEILTNTSPTLIKLNSDVDGFYLRVKGMNGKVTLADSYAKKATGYTIIFGDGDMQTITIKDPSKQ